MAGVTFLAFGNGAPDVLASLSASGNAEGGLVMAVSALVGASFFVSGLIVAVITIVSPVDIHLQKHTFIRDVIVYLLGFGILIAAGIVGEISLPFSILFLVLYASFVTLVFI